MSSTTSRHSYPVLRLKAGLAVRIVRVASVIRMLSEDASNTLAHSSRRSSICLMRPIGVKAVSTASRS
ncbi:MAG: hypothetical protein AW07_01214 [Candidatus Accumulibacter sp. SK-11]|nr:MAG: hypothetical protein AW07_01214 [Candidatus Accumulibacter sp. SK-11]